MNIAATMLKNNLGASWDDVKAIVGVCVCCDNCLIDTSLTHIGLQ
jgi:hypothetical protein